MSESTEGDVSDDEPATTDLWAQVRDEILAEFGYDADISVQQYSNHIEVRVIPTGIKAQLEQKYDVMVVPYQSFQMTIRTDE